VTRGTCNSVGCVRGQVYRNLGTVVHWAAWHRKWAVVSLAVAHGADLAVRGEGCWMNDRTPADYATHLDTAAGHPYYEHREMFDKAALADRCDAVTAVVLATAKRCELEAASFAPGLAVDAAEVGSRLHDMVELSCFRGLQTAFDRFGPAMGRVVVKVVGEEADEFDNVGTVAHWAVWYQNWHVLRWFQRHGCIDLTVVGTGRGWLRGRTVEQYADLMDTMNKHPFYRHRVETAACLTAAPTGDIAVRAPPAAASAADAGGDAAVPPVQERQASECVICIGEPADHLVQPCNHLCIGAECCDIFRGQREVLCPICRAEVTNVVRVFMS
jgi:hypothetical protein